MSQGLLVTDGSDINSAQEEDFIIDTRLIGGMHVYKILNFKYVNANSNDQYYNKFIKYQHNLDFTPAFLAFNDQGIIQGWQNSIIPVDSVNVNEEEFFISFGTGSDISVIVFAESID